MSWRSLIGALTLSCLAALPGWAAVPDAQVEALQMPAWLLRGEQRVPLALGTALQNGDVVVTGREARALLRLADGSTVKLGERARFSLAGLAQPRSGDPTFRANLRVVEGAFRFTTTLLYKYRGKREIDVRFSTLTAGIRGTDLWGKSTGDGDIVALLEGQITLLHPGRAPIRMEQPMTVYETGPQQAPPGPQPLAADRLARFAQETEIAAGAGAAARGGRWRVVASDSATQSEALQAYDRLREAGYPAAIQPYDAPEGLRYRVQVSGLVSEADALALAARLNAELGMSAAPLRR